MVGLHAKKCSGLCSTLQALQVSNKRKGTCCYLQVQNMDQSFPFVVLIRRNNCSMCRFIIEYRLNNSECLVLLPGNNPDCEDTISLRGSQSH